MAAAFRLIITALAVGIGIDILPGVFLLALESGNLWIGVAGVALHTLALGLSIWFVSGRWLREDRRTRTLLSLLAILQFPGAMAFGVIFAFCRHQLERDAV